MFAWRSGAGRLAYEQCHLPFDSRAVLAGDENVEGIDDHPDGSDGTTTRNPQWQNPMWEFTLQYEYIKGSQYDVLQAYTPYTDYQELQGFYLARQGQYDDFLFNDPSDNTVGPQIWTPNTWFPP